VAANAQALGLIERAAAMERCWFAPEGEEFPDIEWPHLKRMRMLGRLLRARVWLRGESGDLPGALADAEAQLRMVAHLVASPGDSLACPVAAAEAGYAMAALEEALSSADLGADNVAGLREAIGALDFDGPFVAGLELERASYVAFLDRFRDRPESFMTDPPPEPRGVERLYRARDRNKVGMWRGWVSVNRAHYLQRMNRRIEQARLPYRMLPAYLRETDVRPERKEEPSWLLMASIGGPYFNVASMQAKRDRAQMRVGLAIIALDLKAYKHERGEYPEALSDLRQASEDGYAEDVFSGEPVVYRREGEGFVAYSLGPDLDDDGGISLREAAAGKSNWDDGDVVWRCER